MLISVVSPVYNCTNCLEEIVRRTRDAFAESDADWELVFVDDRGPGEPWQVIQALAAIDARVHGVRLTRNHGQHLAIWAGLAHTRGDWVGVIDCDLQDDPAVLRTLYDLAQEGDGDAIVVNRGIWHDGRWRRLASRSFYTLLGWATGFRIDGNAGNFGLYSRKMVTNLLAFGDKEVFLPAMVVMTGLKLQSHVVSRDNRHDGFSSYNVRRLTRLATALIIRFSDRPLKISVFAGLGLSGLSGLISFAVLISWACGRIQVAGWASTVLSIWFVGGLILFTLGIHGFYIGRVFSEVQIRPRIRIASTTNNVTSLNVDRVGIL